MRKLALYTPLMGIYVGITFLEDSLVASARTCSLWWRSLTGINLLTICKHSPKKRYKVIHYGIFCNLAGNSGSKVTINKELVKTITIKWWIHKQPMKVYKIRGACSCGKVYKKVWLECKHQVEMKAVL